MQQRRVSSAPESTTIEGSSLAGAAEFPGSERWRVCREGRCVSYQLTRWGNAGNFLRMHATFCLQTSRQRRAGEAVLSSASS